MLSILPPAGPTTPRVPLGQHVTFRLLRARPDVEWRAYLKWEGIYFLKAVRDWSAADQVDLFPEAPGSYTLALRWRDRESGAEGWVRSAFEVGSGAEGHVPVQATIRGRTFWFANGNDAASARAYEQEAMDQLHAVTPRGAVVYDVGANLGLYSVELSSWVGDEGTVYCFEANPVCVSFLQANLLANGCRNCEVLPVALTGGAEQVPFTIHYGHTGLGITSESSFYAGKMGHDILSRGSSLDELTAAYDLRPPDVLKVDIEGAEGPALQGMRRTLERSRPAILLEIHGQGAARECVPLLSSLGYRFVETSSRRAFDGPALLEWFPDQVLQVICRPGA